MLVRWMVRGAPILVICYVDDLLVATPSEAAYRVLFEALEKQVKIRETGRVTMSGGSLKFLGRTILREKGSSGLQLFVDQDYLNSAFEEYGISKGSTAFPDLRPFLEQTLQKSLSALRRTPSSGEFLDVCHGWHRPDRIS